MSVLLPLLKSPEIKGLKFQEAERYCIESGAVGKGVGAAPPDVHGAGTEISLPSFHESHSSETVAYSVCQMSDSIFSPPWYAVTLTERPTCLCLAFAIFERNLM